MGEWISVSERLPPVLENAQDQRLATADATAPAGGIASPLHPVVRWRIFSRSQVSDRRETRVFLGKTAFSDFFWIGAFLPSDIRYT